MRLEEFQGETPAVLAGGLLLLRLFWMKILFFFLSVILLVFCLSAYAAGCRLPLNLHAVAFDVGKRILVECCVAG
jgi:hypothetical protein